jgi:hypothetical protein
MKNVRVRKNNWICDIFWVYYWYLMGSNEIKERWSENNNQIDNGRNIIFNGMFA